LDQKAISTNSLSIRNTSLKQRHTQTNLTGWKNVYQEHGNRKQTGIAILISDKEDFMQKSVRRDKEDHYI
jgi:hypothetical protein